MEALFGKLLAYEHELIQQSDVEDIEKKRKGIALKVKSSKEDYKDSSSSEEDAENFNLKVRKFGKFLKKSKDKNSLNPPRRLETTTTTSYTSNMVRVISNLSVLSTLENMLVKRKERRTENKRKPT